jgi:DNA-binding NarL/FixJ family response regulator
MKKTRVAVVENNVPLRRMVSGWIGQSEELTLVGAYEDAESAMRELPALAPNVVLVYINLPGADGSARKVVQSFQQQTALPAVVLTSREQEIWSLLARGLLYKEIATQLGNSVYTVNAHVRRIYEKLHVNTRAQAIAKFEAHLRWRERPWGQGTVSSVSGQ